MYMDLVLNIIQFIEIIILTIEYNYPHKILRMNSDRNSRMKVKGIMKGKKGKKRNKQLVDLYNKVYDFMRDEDEEIAREMGDQVLDLNSRGSKSGTNRSRKLT